MTERLFKIAELLRQPFTAQEVYDKFVEIHPESAESTSPNSVSATLSRRIGADYEQVEKGQGGKPSLYKVIKAEEVPNEDSDKSPVGGPASPET